MGFPPAWYGYAGGLRGDCSWQKTFFFKGGWATLNWQSPEGYCLFSDQP